VEIVIKTNRAGVEIGTLHKHLKSKFDIQGVTVRADEISIHADDDALIDEAALAAEIQAYQPPADPLAETLDRIRDARSGQVRVDDLRDVVLELARRMGITE
jgi:hypothetical protein